MYQVKLKRIIVLLIIVAMAFAYTGMVGANNDAPNCCNAPGRQCTSNAEWVAGYYAYKRGECPAYVPQTVADERGEAPNCCNAPGRQCTSNAEWVAGYYAYKRGECPAQVLQSAPPAGTSSESANIGSWIQSSSFSKAFAAEAAANSWTKSLNQDKQEPAVYRPLTELPEETSPAEAVEVRNENIRYLVNCFCAVANADS